MLFFFILFTFQRHNIFADSRKFLHCKKSHVKDAVLSCAFCKELDKKMAGLKITCAHTFSLFWLLNIFPSANMVWQCNWIPSLEVEIQKTFFWRLLVAIQNGHPQSMRLFSLIPTIRCHNPILFQPRQRRIPPLWESNCLTPYQVCECVCARLCTCAHVCLHAWVWVDVCISGSCGDVFDLPATLPHCVAALFVLLSGMGDNYEERTGDLFQATESLAHCISADARMSKVWPALRLQ